MHTQYRRRSAAALAALSLAGALALTGCSASDQAAGRADAKAADVAAPGLKEEAAKGAPGAAAAPAAPDGKNQQQAPAARTQIIRTATLSVEAADAQKATAAARTAAENAGGYVGNETTNRDPDGRMTSTVTLRVPGDRFDAVLGAMEGSGKLLDRKVEAQDVTQKVADVDSRVKSQQASVARVREMMEKATGLGEVVTLESELSKRQSDLESLLAQQTALKDQTSLGTITLTFSEPAKPVQKPAKKKEKEPTFLGALEGGWNVFTKIVRYLTVAFGALLPFALTAGIVLLGLRLLRKWRPARPKTGLFPKRVPAARTGRPAAAQTAQPAPGPELPRHPGDPADPANPADVRH
ncbi:DUF4349 domain-containing protein [Streptomyces sp. NPDC048340]|uniref:DUF4349 domain-containing protein n=1 Tax=Streptomyces sp. NPDC048340 TaxID=3365537 RepID=UPI00371E6698